MISNEQQNTAQAELIERKQAAEVTPATSFEFEDMPIIDLNLFIQSEREAGAAMTPEAKAECEKVAECFHKFGIILIRDPRVDMKDNDDYVDLMEDYFWKTGELFYSGEKVDDIKPEHHYQVGATPEFIEKARDHQEHLEELNLPSQDAPDSPLTPTLDAKWRFMWKIGDRPDGASDDFPAVLPNGFPDWETKMNRWGGKLLDGIFTVAQMAAVGMGVEKNTLLDKMQGGAHLLAPTGSDLVKNDVGAVFAGFHYDISFMTIHGKSRYPGLSVWTRDWKKRAVKIPQGCLLIQAGISFEYITGGYVLGGFHEVVYTDATKEAVIRRQEKLNEEGSAKKQWRVSSTMFTHFRNDMNIGPLPELKHLYSEEALTKYPNLTAFEILMQELRATGMAMD